MGGIEGPLGVSGMHWGAGREFRCSGARRGIGGIGGPLGGIEGHWRYEGCIGGLAGSLSAQGQQGYRGHWGS